MSTDTIDFWKRPSVLEPFLLREDDLADLLHGYFATEYASEPAKITPRNVKHGQWMDWFSAKDPMTREYMAIGCSTCLRDEYESIRKICQRNRLHFDHISGLIYWYKENNGYKNQYNRLMESLRYDLLGVKFVLEQELVRDFFTDVDCGHNVRRCQQAKEVRQWFEAAGETHYAWMFDSRKYAEVFAMVPKDPQHRKPVMFVGYLEHDVWLERSTWSTSQTLRQREGRADRAEPNPAVACRSIGSRSHTLSDDYLEPPPPYCESSSASDLSSTFGLAYESGQDISGSNDPLRDMMR